MKLKLTIEIKLFSRLELNLIRRAAGFIVLFEQIEYKSRSKQ